MICLLLLRVGRFSRPFWVFYINTAVEEFEGHTDNKYKMKAMRNTILGLQ